MNLADYFSQPGSMSVATLRDRIGVKSDAQIRQWQHGYADRRPGPTYCTAIEQATERQVCRWDLRPEDWHLIWPELIGAEGAPAAPVAENPVPDVAA